MFRSTRTVLIWLAAMTLWAQASYSQGFKTLGAGSSAPASGSSPVFNTTVFNCTSFVPTGGISGGNCETTFGSFSSAFFVMTGAFNGNNPFLSSGAVDIIPSACQHCAGGLIYQTLVNIQKFQTTFRFVSSGWNFSLVINNTTNNPSANGANFTGGAGCEGGFWQGFAQASPPNNVFGLMYDQFSGLTAGAGGNGNFNSYTGVQYYDTGNAPPSAPNGPGQSPCNPDLGNSFTCGCYTYHGVNKISTFPVPLTTPCTVGTCSTFYNNMGVNVGTGDTYEVTITYDGSNMTADLFDVTGGGTCTPVTSGTCNHVTWTGVSIPTIVGANTAWVGLNSSTADNSSTIPLLISKWSYKVP